MRLPPSVTLRAGLRARSVNSAGALAIACSMKPRSKRTRWLS